MRQILKITVLAGLLALATAAEAQQYGALTLLSNAIVVTNAGTSAVTTNGTVAGVTRYDQVLLEVDFKLMTAGTSGDNPIIAWNWGGTTNGTTTGTGSSQATITQNGTTTVRWATNLAVGSAGYLNVTFSGTTNVFTTNLNVKAWYKPRRAG
jgi:hypothetical protein